MAERKRRRKPIRITEDLPKINCDAAGIDIGATELWVAVPANRDSNPVQKFSTFTADLYALADWLHQCRIRSVAMESTGVYWIPLYQVLEDRGFEVVLANARHVKNVAGRKTDVLDCQWIQLLHSYGLLSGSFRPSADICVLRSYLRHRQMLVQYAAAHVQHMQKALTQMNLHLHHVIADITGVTGMKIIRAIVNGERSPKVLASMKNYRVKSTEEEIAKALEGDYRSEHLFSLQQALALFDFYHDRISDCDQQIAAHLRTVENRIDVAANPLPKARGEKAMRRNALNFDCRPEAYRISGVDLTQIDGISESSALMLLAEIGTDMKRWKTEKHFASWLSICPNNKISGGKVLQRQTKKSVNRARDVLRICAQSLMFSKSALGAYCRRMCGRLGKPKGITATAHKLACLVYRMLKFGKQYVDIGQDQYESKYKERLLRHLTRRASDFGFRLLPLAAPPTQPVP